jgi:hypothetical protein
MSVRSFCESIKTNQAGYSALSKSVMPICHLAWEAVALQHRRMVAGFKAFDLQTGKTVHSER